MTGSGHLGVRPLLVVGAGGFARETVAAIRAVNDRTPTFKLMGILDDDPAREGTTIGDVPVLGPAAAVHDWPDALAVICTGRPGDYTSRVRIAERLNLPDERYARIVHPAASLEPATVVGPGTVVLAHVTATIDVTIGRHVAVMPQTVLTHDVVVSDFATLATAVTLGGGVVIGSAAYLASRVAVREGLTIGEMSLVGMGSVVLEDIPARRVWFGSPARDVRGAEICGMEPA